jgi:hypothetical protein
VAPKSQNKRVGDDMKRLLVHISGFSASTPVDVLAVIKSASLSTCKTRVFAMEMVMVIMEEDEIKSSLMKHSKHTTIENESKVACLKNWISMIWYAKRILSLLG